MASYNWLNAEEISAYTYSGLFSFLILAQRPLLVCYTMQKASYLIEYLFKKMEKTQRRKIYFSYSNKVNQLLLNFL